MNEYKDAQFEQKPDGIILVDGQEVAHTRQCGHCGSHFISVKGSGKVRGFCMLCMRVLCGRKECFAHVPIEKRLEIEEKNHKLNQTKREFLIEQEIKKQEKGKKYPTIGEK